MASWLTPFHPCWENMATAVEDPRSLTRAESPTPSSPSPCSSAPNKHDAASSFSSSSSSSTNALRVAISMTSSFLLQQAPIPSNAGGESDQQRAAAMVGTKEKEDRVAGKGREEKEKARMAMVAGRNSKWGRWRLLGDLNMSHEMCGINRNHETDFYLTFFLSLSPIFSLLVLIVCFFLSFSKVTPPLLKLFQNCT